MDFFWGERNVHSLGPHNHQHIAEKLSVSSHAKIQRTYLSKQQAKGLIQPLGWLWDKEFVDIDQGPPLVQANCFGLD
jgi:hypothetical protein